MTLGLNTPDSCNPGDFNLLKKNQWLFMAPVPKVSNTESNAETYKL